MFGPKQDTTDYKSSRDQKRDEMGYELSRDQQDTRQVKLCFGGHLTAMYITYIF